MLSDLYPRIGLENIIVKFGFTGLSSDGSVSRSTIDVQVPDGQERSLGLLLWRCVVLRAIQSALSSANKPMIGEMMSKYSDPEVWEHDCETADKKLEETDKTVLVVFDALDSLALDWERLRQLTDALLEVAWSTRGYSSVRVKLFLRPDQLRDMGLRFVELPKLIAGAANLTWSGVDLYGMLFTRLGGKPDNLLQGELSKLYEEEGIASLPSRLGKRRSWPLVHDRNVQSRVFTRLAGPYMGRSNKKGKTYDWPLKHLSDGHDEVTPRSFLTLMIEAARHSPNPVGLRKGLVAVQVARVRA